MWKSYVKCFRVYYDHVEDTVNNFLNATYNLHSPENVQLVSVDVKPLPATHADMFVTITYELREGDRDLTRENERS